MLSAAYSVPSLMRSFAPSLVNLDMLTNFTGSFFEDGFGRLSFLALLCLLMPSKNHLLFTLKAILTLFNLAHLEHLGISLPPKALSNCLTPHSRHDVFNTQQVILCSMLYSTA